MVSEKLVNIELINKNRLLPILEELSIPWKDASVVKLLGKNFGFNIMKNRLDVEIMHVGNDFFQGKVLSELECQV
jgi:hypothetical protein